MSLVGQSLSVISIHLMLLFNTTARTAVLTSTISIHLMLLFNFLAHHQAPQVLDISIHLMLLFNRRSKKAAAGHRYFNTSNVTIQPFPLPFPTSYYYISIHLMLLFNLALYSVEYYLLIISIHLMLLFNIHLIFYKPFFFHFNTSNVTIQPTILSHLFYSQFRYTHYISAFL